MKDHQTRSRIKPGTKVRVAVKVNGKYKEELYEGIVQNILTNSSTHHRGIKVRLTDGTVGRIQKIITEESIPKEVMAAVDAQVNAEFPIKTEDRVRAVTRLHAMEERKKELLLQQGYEYQTLFERGYKF